MLPVTAFFAAIFGIMYVVLAVLVIRRRVALGLPLGDGGDISILRRIRAHANFAEYVPFCLLLMGISELQRASQEVVAGLGCVLLLGRIFHAYGVIAVEGKDPRKIRFRQIGMMSTFSVLIVASLMLIIG